jgi:hypothetical protein
MKVIDKEKYNNGEIITYKVYDIKRKNGFPYFLIYTNNQWIYKSAKHFIPEEVI